MPHLWKYWDFKSFENQALEREQEESELIISDKKMPSKATNLWERESNKTLSEENKRDIISNGNEIKEKTEMVDIPELPLEDLETAAESVDSSVQDESGGSVVFGIIGAGQAGGRLAESFYKLGYKKCLTVNTAKHDLDGLVSVPDSQKVLMTTGTTGGAGKDMAKGERAADKHQQEIYERMQKVFGKVDRVLICAGAGGGTGSGSCLRLVETAKKYLAYLGSDNVNRKVGVLLTLPTAGESASPIVAENANLISTKLCEYAKDGDISPLIIFDNNKIKNMYPNLTVAQFWPTVNSTVTGLFHLFNVLSTKTGNPTSFDPADYNRVLSSAGCMIMGFTTVKEYNDGTDISRAIRENLDKTLLCGGFDLSTAKSAACIATASENILNNVPGLMLALETGFDTLANITGNASVFRGVYSGDKEKLVVYTMVTGLDAPKSRLDELVSKFKNVKEKSRLYE